MYLYKNQLVYLVCRLLARLKYKMTKWYLSIMRDVNRVYAPLRYRDNTRASCDVLSMTKYLKLYKFIRWIDFSSVQFIKRTIEFTTEFEKGYEYCQKCGTRQ